MTQYALEHALAEIARLRLVVATYNAVADRLFATQTLGRHPRPVNLEGLKQARALAREEDL